MITLFATCARGFEELLKNELVELGASTTKIVQGGVRFEVDKHGLYRSLLWSRLASRILLPIATGKIFDEVDLYGLAVAQPWKDYFTQTDSFRVDFTGTNNIIRHTQYGAMRVKDGVVDYFERKSLPRPNVDKEYPDIRLHAYLNRDEVTLYLDLSGESLHRRGYREISGEAPLRETLAAAIILRSGYQKGEAVVDPMCGSGTLLIEAAQIAADIAPRLDRIEWGFRRWLGHEESIWQEILSEADERKFDGLQEAKPLFYGFDIDSKVLNKAKHNAKMAGVDKLIRFARQDVAQLKNPLKESEKSGLVVSNPPYGERLGSTPALIALYNVFGERLKAEFGGWRASIFSGEPQLLDCLRMRAKRQFKARNGALECIQKNYLISEQRTANQQIDTSQQETIVATDFANRLQKNMKKIDKWAAQQGLDAYRLYDADLPEYNLAVDRYADHIVVQEYAAPKNIDPQKSRQRLLDAVSATLSITGVETNKLVLKTREKQKGRNQYEKQGDQGNYFVVDEFNAQFWVNVTDYLDTGLFLDHRLTRKMVGEMAKGKDFLNLFAYTGSATIYAQLGGQNLQQLLICQTPI